MSRVVVLVHSACAPARACSGPRRGMSRLDFRGRAACSMAVERHSEQRASGATGRRLVACPRNSHETSSGAASREPEAVSACVDTPAREARIRHVRVVRIPSGLDGSADNG